MNRENDISEELSKMGSSLASLPRSMPYHVPHGYFENVAGALQIIVNDLGEPDVVPAWSSMLPYSVPDGYFEGLTGKIVANVLTDEQIARVPGRIPFVTPAGYFESLPQAMLAAAKADDANTKKTKIIPLTRRNMPLPIRWAAAAVLLITIGLGSYMVFNQPSGNPEKMLASVPANEIQDYLQGAFRGDVNRVVVGNNDVNSLQLENKDIIEYLNETGWD